MILPYSQEVLLQTPGTQLESIRRWGPWPADLYAQLSQTLYLSCLSFLWSRGAHPRNTQKTSSIKPGTWSLPSYDRVGLATPTSLYVRIESLPALAQATPQDFSV